MEKTQSVLSDFSEFERRDKSSPLTLLPFWNYPIPRQRVKLQIVLLEIFRQTEHRRLKLSKIKCNPCLFGESKFEFRWKLKSRDAVAIQNFVNTAEKRERDKNSPETISFDWTS